MADRCWPVFLLAILNLGIFAPPCDTQELRCQCTQIVSEPISCELIKNMTVIYKNIYCDRMEVIAVLKTGDVVCLDPKAECVRNIIDNITRRVISEGYIPEGYIPKGYLLKDDTTKNYLNGMKITYSVEFEKPLYLSFMEPQD